MKHLLAILALLTLASCNDTLRTRLPRCQGADGRLVDCSYKDALSTQDKFRKSYLAEVTIPISASNTKIILLESAKDAEDDSEYNCELDVAKGTQFIYQIKDGYLKLENGITKLILKKINGTINDGLEGVWEMTEDRNNVREETELEFYNDELRITKSCKLK